MGFLKTIILSLVIIIGCIDPYDFSIENAEPTLVVESYISNVSFNETLTYPSEGHYFTVGLRYTSDVINIRDKTISGATINLVNHLGEEWYYTESSNEPGKYILENKTFKAVDGISYKLQIILPEGTSYESEWEKLPAKKPPAMGTIDFEEIEKQVLIRQRDDDVVQTIKGVDVNVELPANHANGPIFYRWDFTPVWVYTAPMASWEQSKCWVTNENYLSNYTLQLDHVGSYKKALFFVETERNERIYEHFSVLITQYAMSEDFYYFWDEMQQQTEKEGLFDPPPYNLSSNISAANGERVSGYFGVVYENARRWYFNKSELSYTVVNTIGEDCEVNAGPAGPPPACLSCLAYGNGVATNVPPSWWEN